MDRCLDRRHLAIALNATDVISRGALCRLAAEPELWASPRGETAVASAAHRLGVPAGQLRRALRIRRRASALVDDELERAERNGCRLLTCFDDDFPQPLLELALPPPVLYCRGTLPESPGVAIVGSRKMDAYGRECAELFARELAAAGLVVVSGFALGVDQVAHRAALSVPHGRTVAVLGCGIDVDYPRRCGELAAAIAERGAVISEFAFGTHPLPWRFPVRNRIIAALAAGTLVVQAKARSGAINTAHHALELGRDVYAVPGRISDHLAAGTNALIADGALVARRPRDLLEGLPLSEQLVLFPSTKQQPGGPPTSETTTRETKAGTIDPSRAEPLAADPPRVDVPSPREEPLPPGLAGKVLGAVPPGHSRTAEELAAAVAKPVDRVLGVLLELELAGRLRREPGPVYLRPL